MLWIRAGGKEGTNVHLKVWCNPSLGLSERHKVIVTLMIIIIIIIAIATLALS